VAAVVWLVVLAGCGVTEEELERVLADAARCEPGDQCVIHGGNDCRCPRPINEQSIDAVDEALAGYDCKGLLVSCPAVYGPIFCEEGLCVSD